MNKGLNPIICATADGKAVRLFRHIDTTEAKEMRAWARENYKVGEPIRSIWHPVVRAECEAMSAERLVLQTVPTTATSANPA